MKDKVSLPLWTSTKLFLTQCYGCIMSKTGCSVHAGVCWGDSMHVCRRHRVDLAVGNVSHLCHFHVKCDSSTHLPLWIDALNDSCPFFKWPWVCSSMYVGCLMDLHTEKPHIVRWISEYRCTGLRENRINRKLKHVAQQNKINHKYHKDSNTQWKISLRENGSC